MKYAKTEIVGELNSKAEALINWFNDKPIEQMEFAPDGAWTAGQHLLHLIKSTKPLGKGMSYPRLLLIFKFGRVKEPSRTFEGVIQSYKDALAKGGQATGGFVPRSVSKEEREELINRFRNEISVLTNQLNRWSEDNLDKTAVPHPLIGNLTVREMLYFTIYHMEHHLNTLNERYS